MRLGSVSRQNIIRQVRFVFFIFVSILLNLLLLVSRIAAGTAGNVLGLDTWETQTNSLTVNAESITNSRSAQNNYFTNIQSKDKRVYVLDEYFRANNSPLYGTAKIMVDKCDQYGAPKDCVILAAIARNETDLCKYHNSASMFNCWGFGGGGIYRINFNSWEEAIDRVTSVLVQQYGNRYIIDPSLMERTFCGDEPGCTDWGNKIKSFVKEIDDFSVSLGVGSILSLRE